jgi:hypothetical protein
MRNKSIGHFWLCSVTMLTGVARASPDDDRIKAANSATSLYRGHVLTNLTLRVSHHKHYYGAAISSPVEEIFA